MAELRIQAEKIRHNITALSHFFKQHDIQWSLVTKVFSGEQEFLKHVLTPEVIQNISSVGDSRLTSLKNLKAVNPDMRTIYIKPPAKVYADEVVEYADISLNSSLGTIKALNEAARKVGKVHEIIIMIELGELREGVQREDLMDFYEQVFDLPHIEVIGIGSNLGCMYGIEPNYDKLLQLVLYKELISARFNKELRYISGGTSITLPLIEAGSVPKEVNHFRVGEAAFFGVSPLKNEPFQELHTDTFEFAANIIELEEKPLVPEGTLSDANIGHTADFSDDAVGQTRVKAILDFGLLDVAREDLETLDPDVQFVGMTSDMIVVDLGTNKDGEGKKRYGIGDKIIFRPTYMGVARLLNSKFIDQVYL